MATRDDDRSLTAVLVPQGDLCAVPFAAPEVDAAHAELLRELAEHLRSVFERSPDGVYLFLNDRHKVCNERLAHLFGVTPAEWAALQPFQEHFVAAEDRDRYCWYYEHRVLALAFPATIRFCARRPDGSTFLAETDMIPLSYRDYAVGYNFVRKVGD